MVLPTCESTLDDGGWGVELAGLERDGAPRVWASDPAGSGPLGGLGLGGLGAVMAPQTNKEGKRSGPRLARSTPQPRAQIGRRFPIDCSLGATLEPRNLFSHRIRWRTEPFSLRLERETFRSR